MKIFPLLMLSILFTSNAYGQEEVKEDRQIKYKERTEIDFEGVDVVGELVKPAGKLLINRRKASFNPLIQLRKNFDQEMIRSTKDIQ